MDTFFRLQHSEHKSEHVRQLRKVPVLIKIACRGVWERWHARFGQDPRFVLSVTGNDITKRYGRSTRWNTCDINANNKAGVADQIYDYVEVN